MPNTVTPSTDERKLTLKQRKFIAHYLEHGNATDAAMHAYNCKDRVSAGAVGYETLKSLQIDELMEEAGISDRRLLQALTEGLDANKVVSAVIVGKQANEQTNDFIDVPDFPTRHKYLETALKLKKRLGPENVTNQQINVNSDKGNAITFVNFNHEPESK